MTEFISQNNLDLPKVAILLATYNGQRFLHSQLDSFVKQTYTNWQIFASDDGSLDETINILDSYKNRLGNDRITTASGPRLGFAANFLSMTQSADINASYYAYADQDDIWEANKLKCAIDWLVTIPKDTPALYCSRAQLIDEYDNEIGYSPLFRKNPGFANALVQTIGGGNTMVFNQAARDLICQVVSTNIMSHDWLAYMVIAGCGGAVLYDPRPLLKYRQHTDNLIGTNSTWRGRLARIKILFCGGFRAWNDKNILAIESIKTRLAPKNQIIFEHFLAARQSWLIPRLINFLKAGIYRQTLLGNLGLIAAAVFNKI